MEVFYLKGKSETGKTIALKLLYCIFCENGAQDCVSVGFQRNSIEPAHVRKSIEALKYTNTGGRKETVQNLAVKFSFQGKTVLIYTCGDTTALVKEGIDLAKKNRVDFYIAPTHKGFVALIEKEFPADNVEFIEKNIATEKENYFGCNLDQAQKLFQMINEKLSD